MHSILLLTLLSSTLAIAFDGASNPILGRHNRHHHGKHGKHHRPRPPIGTGHPSFPSGRIPTPTGRFPTRPSGGMSIPPIGEIPEPKPGVPALPLPGGGMSIMPVGEVPEPNPAPPALSISYKLAPTKAPSPENPPSNQHINKRQDSLPEFQFPSPGAPTIAPPPPSSSSPASIPTPSSLPGGSTTLAPPAPPLNTSAPIPPSPPSPPSPLPTNIDNPLPPSPPTGTDAPIPPSPPLGSGAPLPPPQPPIGTGGPPTATGGFPPAQTTFATFTRGPIPLPTGLDDLPDFPDSPLPNDPIDKLRDWIASWRKAFKNWRQQHQQRKHRTH